MLPQDQSEALIAAVQGVLENSGNYLFLFLYLQLAWELSNVMDKKCIYDWIRLKTLHKKSFISLFVHVSPWRAEYYYTYTHR